FQTQVRDRMLSVLPHIELYVPRMAAEEVLTQWQEIAKMATENREVKGTAPFVAAQGMIVRGETLSGVQMRGIDPTREDAVSDIAGQMISGDLNSLKAGSFSIVLGNQIANTLGVSTGDTVLVLAPQGSISPAGFAPRMRQFTVSGIFSSGY